VADGRQDAHVAQDRLILLTHACARAKPIGHDGNEPAARLKTAQRRLQMTDCGIVVGAAADRPRKGRVHQDEGWSIDACEGGIDGRTIVPGDRC
jgi:hypothetical protein